MGDRIPGEREEARSATADRAPLDPPYVPGQRPRNAWSLRVPPTSSRTPTARRQTARANRRGGAVSSPGFRACPGSRSSPAGSATGPRDHRPRIPAGCSTRGTSRAPSRGGSTTTPTAPWWTPTGRSTPSRGTRHRGAGRRPRTGTGRRARTPARTRPSPSRSPKATRKRSSKPQPEPQPAPSPGRPSSRRSPSRAPRSPGTWSTARRTSAAISSGRCSSCLRSRGSSRHSSP